MIGRCRGEKPIVVYLNEDEAVFIAEILHEEIARLAADYVKCRNAAMQGVNLGVRERISQIIVKVLLCKEEENGTDE